MTHGTMFVSMSIYITFNATVQLPWRWRRWRQWFWWWWYHYICFFFKINYIILLWTIINHINHKSYFIIINILSLSLSIDIICYYISFCCPDGLNMVEHFAGRRWLWAPCWALMEWSRIGSRRRPFRHRKYGIEPTTSRDIMGISLPSCKLA